ncbi:MAG: pilus assembly protein TadG-related protein [Actinomycetota bacterium]|nr:pilus assembly protein TadG-related protein [Actinomycetota bacterium]
MKIYKEIPKKIFLNQNGQVAVIIVILIVVILGMTALVIDLGSLYQKRGFYQTVADAAALAGAQELPESVQLAVYEAVEYAEKNNVDIAYNCRDYTAEGIEVSSTYAQNDTITVALSNREAPLYFARIFGMDTVSLSAEATAVAGSPVQLYGVVPWAVVIPEGTNWREWLWNVAGDRKIISGEMEDSDFIAWDTTDHPGQWNRRYKDRLTNGYQEPMEEGNMVFTRGFERRLINHTVSALNSRIDTWESFYQLTYYDPYTNMIKLSRDDDQFVMVPIIYDTELQEWWEEYPEDWPEVWVEIEAFAPFIITDIREVGYGHNKRKEIIGRFTHQALIINKGEIGAFNGNPAVGLKVIRLWD